MSQAAARKLENLLNLEAGYNCRVIVVDDEPEILRAYKAILQPAQPQTAVKSSRLKVVQQSDIIPSDFEVTQAASADEALKLVREAIHQGRPFAMGFFDVMLGPQSMDGIQLVKEIREIDPNMHAVFVTAYNDRNVDSINKILGGSEFWDYLNKPFAEGEILQKARNAVSFWNLRREKQLQDQKLADANRHLVEKERLMSVATVARGVGHEFGNILVQIMGRADLSKDGNETQMREALQTIFKASETASQILERFKNLAKPSEVKIEKAILWAHEPIETALSLMDHQLDTGNIKVCWIKRDKVMIEANATSLVQVFVNLFINALHAMGSGSGQLDLSVMKVAKRVEIRVRDYGTGIPDNIIDRIFEPFFTTKKNKGTGLGLAICKEIIEIEHDGELEVHNHRDKGAEFVITFEAKEPLEGGKNEKSKSNS